MKGVHVVGLAFVAFLAYSLSNGYAVLVDLLRHLPVLWVEAAMIQLIHFYTFHYYRLLDSIGIISFEDCFEQDEKKVIIVPVKAGVVLTIGISLEIAKMCDVTVGINRAATKPIWPVGPLINPVEELDLFLAIANPIKWQEKMKGNFACVAITRDPFDRFMSLYKYARDGAEDGLSHHAAAMNLMNSTTERVDYAWTYIGRTMMETTHEGYMQAKHHENCKLVKGDGFVKGGQRFQDATAELLSGLHVKKSMIPKLLEAIKVHDISGARTQHSHVSGKSVTVAEEKHARDIIVNSPGIYNALRQQQLELGYGL